MASYTYQQIIDELKSLYVQARSVKAQAKIAQRVVNSADSFKTRKTNEANSLETKLDSVNALLDSSLPNSLDQLDAIKRDSYGIELAQIKAKLTALNNWKQELITLNSEVGFIGEDIPGNQYLMPSITQGPTIELLANMVQTIIASIETTFGDVYNGSKYLGVKGAADASSNGPEPDSEYDVTQEFESKISFFGTHRNALTDMIASYVQATISNADGDRNEANTLRYASMQLDFLKTQLAEALLSEAPQSTIDQCQQSIDAHKVQMVNDAKAAKKNHFDGEAERFARLQLMVNAHTSLVRAEDELRSYYQANERILSYDYGRIVDKIDLNWMYIFGSIFSSLNFQSSGEVSLPPAFNELRSDAELAKYNTLMNNRQIDSAERLFNKDPFEALTDANGRQDVRWNGSFDGADRKAHADMYFTYRSAFSGVIDEIAAKEAGIEALSQYNNRFSQAHEAALYTIVNYYVPARAEFVSASFNYQTLNSGVWGTTPEEVNAWSQAFLDNKYEETQVLVAEKKAWVAEKKADFLTAKYPGISSYNSIKGQFNQATAQYTNYWNSLLVVYGLEPLPSGIDLIMLDYNGLSESERAALDGYSATVNEWQSALNQLGTEYPEAYQSRVDLESAITLLADANYAKSVKQTILNDLVATLTFVAASEANMLQAEGDAMVLHNRDKKANFYWEKVNNLISVCAFCTQKIGPLTEQSSSWDSNIESKWELAKTSFMVLCTDSSSIVRKKSEQLIGYKVNELELNKLLAVMNDLNVLGDAPGFLSGFVDKEYRASLFNPSEFDTKLSTFTNEYMTKGDILALANSVIDKANNY